MPISQLPQAPHRQDRKIFPTPIIGDVLFSEVRDCNRGNPFSEYGTPHPNANKWPDHKLVYIKPVDIERNEIFEFFYAAERENQDLYNFALGNRVIANREFRMVTRTYVTLRENFKPEDIEFGTPMPDIPEGKFDGVSYVFFDKEQQNTQQEELNSLFVIEVHTYLEAAVLDEKLTLSVEKQDPLPPKFRVLAPTTTTDELAEGEVTAPTLTGDQLAVTEEQVNTDLKRKRTVSRSSAENIGSLGGKQVTNDLQVANVLETLVPDGTTIRTSELTVDGSVESLGNGLSVQRVITAPKLFTAKSYSTQRPDPTPEKFRALIPTESTEESVAGTAEMPKLTAGDLEATEQQVNVHVKRKRKTRRDFASLPKTLNQTATTNEKQVATIKETLQKGDTSVPPSATRDVQSEALGDETYLVRETTVPELFRAEVFSTQRPDVTPEKFRVFVPSSSSEETIEGIAEQPTLATGDLEITEQQVNKFVKRKRKTSRDLTGLPQSHIQKATTNEKIVAITTETLQNGDTSVSPSATVDVQSESLGDGTYVVRTTTAPVFGAQSYSSQQPNTVPEKFLVQAKTKTSTRQANKVGKASMPQLAKGELERTHQQINEYVYREQIVEQNIPTSVNLPQVQRAYVEGAVARVDEKLSSSNTIETGLLISQSEATPIGDGKFIVQTVKVDSWPLLRNSEWDYELNTQTERTEQYVPPPTSFSEKNVQYKSINRDRSLKIKETPPTGALEAYKTSFPIRVDVQLPNVLKTLKVKWVKEKAEGEFDTRFDGYSSGTSSSLSGTEGANVDSTCTIKPELIVEIAQPWGSDIPATSYAFFMKSSSESGLVISESALLSKLGEMVGSPVDTWPVFKPVSNTVILTGVKATITAKASASASSSYSSTSSMWDKTEGDGQSYDYNYSVTAVTIPPTIHKTINIEDSQDKTESVTATCRVGWTGYGGFPSVNAVGTITKNLTGKVEPKSIDAVQGQQEIPSKGYYVLKSSVEPYKWGYAKCAAVVLDASDIGTV